MSVRTVQLGEVATIERCAATKTECANLPFVGLEHVESGSGNFAVEFKRRPEPMLATKFRFGAEHVLYGKLRPYLNKVVLPDFDGVCTTEILPILPKPGAIERRFLYALLLSPYFVRWASLRVSGANLPRLDPGMLEEFYFDLPSLPEQERIARLLEQANRLRRTRRYTLELSDTFLPAAFVSLFGNPAKNPKYPLVPLGELIVSGPQNGLYKHASAYGSGTRIVRIDAYQNGSAIDFAELQRVRLSSDEIATYGLLEGDFLINRVNSRTHLGKSTVVPHLSEPAVYESNMMRFRVDEKRLNPIYAAQFLHTPFINEQIQRRAKDASNQSSINQDDVEGFAVLLPPHAAQQHFATLVSRHERLRARQRESLRQADHLFQSLLGSAFSLNGS